MPPRPFLRALAEQFGILSSYIDQSGHVRHTPDRARIALLRAMNVEARTEAGARAALTAERARRVAQVVAPVHVATAAAARRLVLGARGRDVRAWRVEITREDGAELRLNGRGRRHSITLPRLPLGYHSVRLTLTSDDGTERVAEQRLIVVPPRCPTPRDRLAARSVYGVLANLYTVRGASNWGFGDLSDLRRLAEWAADVGASFVGVNPLHALENRGDQISPYSPVSRLYRNALYLDATAAPEWDALPSGVRRRLARAHVLGRLRGAERVDYESVRALKWPAFVALHRAFVAGHRDGGGARAVAYRRYLAEEGEALLDFATFAALREHFARRGIGSWRRWPAAYRDPRSPAVRTFRAARRDAIDLHCYLQFELDRQLGSAAAAARERGLPLGVYQDLALGSSRRGSDAWAFPGLFVDGVDLGAPPDDYSATGQNWQLPPLDPRALAATGYDYWVRLLRTALRHAGALRIDHVMGLFRQYWIPAGASGADGAYIRFPADDLLGILALESQRAGALVIGEDLGTVPRGLPQVLAHWSVLSTRVLYFERTRRGAFRPARAYPRRALVGANTHDLVPLAGFWEGTDLVLRRRTGVLPDDDALAAALAARARERRALCARLRREGVLPAGRVGGGRAALPDLSAPELAGAVHAFLARTPAILVGLSLDDLTGEREPVNLPGVLQARHPSWTRRMQLPVESLPDDPDVARALDMLPSSARSARRTTIHRKGRGRARR